MADEDRERWTKLVADFETSDLTQGESASERRISFSNLRSWIYRLCKESRPLAERRLRHPVKSRPPLFMGTSAGHHHGRLPDHSMRRS